MDLPPIASRQNPLIRQLRRARDGGDPAHFLVEGVRFLEEALKANVKIEAVVVTDAAAESERGKPLIKKLLASGVDVRRATDDVLDCVAATQSSPGFAALVRRAPAALEQVFAGAAPFVVVAAGVSDPGNLGTLIRTAAAAGATGFVTTKDSVSPWNDKALRASAGSIFHLPLAANVNFTDVAEIAKKVNVRIAAAASGGGESYHRANLKPPLALILGSEGFGLAAGVREAADLIIHIPLARGIESLNVASAGAILCFEILRQAPAPAR